MTAPTMTVDLIPTGGAVSIKIVSDATTVTLSRAVYDPGTSTLSAFTTLKSCAPSDIALFIDAGEMLQTPLDQTKQYVYKVVDDQSNLYQSDPVSVACTVTMENEYLSSLFIKLMKGGLRALSIPKNFLAPNVVSAMPLSGSVPLPIISINATVLHQDDIPIGQQVVFSKDADGATWYINGMATRVFTVGIQSMNVDERDFYRDAVICLFHAILNNPLSEIGEDISHRYYCESSQMTGKDSPQNQPGFYFSEILLEIQGKFDVTIQTNFGIVEDFVPDEVIV